MQTPELCLILTSTIEVPFKELVGRSDTAERLQDYRKALCQWMTGQNEIQKIIFADNSGYDLTELREASRQWNQKGKQIEFLSLQPSLEVRERGKSYGEIDILRQSFERSELLKTADYFVKSTGRIYVSNIGKIVRSLPHSFDVVGRFSHNLAYFDTPFVIFRNSYFQKKILPYALENACDEDYEYIERVVAKSVLRSLAENYRWYPFAYEPVIQGYSGTKNKPYGRGWWHGITGSILSRLYHRFYKTVYDRKKRHLLEIFKKWPAQEEEECSVS